MLVLYLQSSCYFFFPARHFSLHYCSHNTFHYLNISFIFLSKRQSFLPVPRGQFMILTGNEGKLVKSIIEDFTWTQTSWTSDSKTLGQCDTFGNDQTRVIKALCEKARQNPACRKVRGPEVGGVGEPACFVKFSFLFPRCPVSCWTMGTWTKLIFEGKKSWGPGTCCCADPSFSVNCSKDKERLLSSLSHNRIIPPQCLLWYNGPLCSPFLGQSTYYVIKKGRSADWRGGGGMKARVPTTCSQRP